MPRILVADDDALIRKYIEITLSASGHEVSVAVDGLDAREQLETETFDLLITDLMMPRLSGEELIAGAVEDHPDLAILVVSAKASYDPPAREEGLPGIGFLQKPVRATALKKKIDSLIALQE